MEKCDDPASVVLGDLWRSPSSEEVEELIQAIRKGYIKSSYDRDSGILTLFGARNAFKESSISFKNHTPEQLLNHESSFVGSPCAFWTRNLGEENEYAIAYSIDSFWFDSLTKMSCSRYKYIPVRPVYPVNQ